MLLHNGGTLLATTVAAFIPVSWLPALTVVFQLFSGLHYFLEKELRASIFSFVDGSQSLLFFLREVGEDTAGSAETKI